MSMDNKIYYYLDQVEKLNKGEFVPPVSCEIDPSNSCNLKCNFCMFGEWRETHHEHLDLDLYISAIGDLSKMGTKSITFTGGGEPLMNPNYNLMAKMAKSLGFQIGLVTNGVLLDTVENLEDYLFIRISLDAHNVKDYKKVKGMDHFDRVIKNIKKALKRNKIIGLSYVVGPDNNKDLQKAEDLANELGAAYIQIKPSYINDRGEIFTDFEYPDGRSISTKRYLPEDNVPCTIAALTGIIGANGDVYYCCQGRGVDRLILGNLRDKSFKELWTERLKLRPNVSLCPMCRYMNYTKAYKSILENGDLFFQHRYFL
ncbi:MAG: radical SAM protein [Candidatus Heimdallarchaeaceae archaeon]